MEVESQIEDKIHSSADFLAGAFNHPFAAYEAALKPRGKLLKKPKSACFHL